MRRHRPSGAQKRRGSIRRLFDRDVRRPVLHRPCPPRMSDSLQAAQHRLSPAEGAAGSNLPYRNFGAPEWPLGVGGRSFAAADARSDFGASRHTGSCPAKVGNAPSRSDPGGYRERQVWGIFAHTPRGQPPAAERRFRTFRPSPRNGEVRPMANVPWASCDPEIRRSQASARPLTPQR